MEFRQRALAKLQSPEELDLPVRLARPQGRLVLVVTVLVMAAASLWAGTGSVSTTLSADGILTYADGSYTLQSPVSGQVTTVLAEEGELLSRGAPLLRVRTDEGAQTVDAVARGRVTTLIASVGSVVSAGEDVATLEHVSDADEPLLAMLYVPADSAASIPAGASVDLAVQSVPQEQYGVLRGRVEAVGSTPQTRRQLASFLGDSQLAAQFSQDGNPIAVLVRLKRSATTASGYAWSDTDGPPYGIDSRTQVTGTVRLATQHPIEWLFP